LATPEGALADVEGADLGPRLLLWCLRREVRPVRASADRFAANTLPIIKQIQASGVSTLRGIAEAFAARGVPTARGGDWTPVQVSNLMRRAI
jgi:hypothetical protein